MIHKHINHLLLYSVSIHPSLYPTIHESMHLFIYPFIHARCIHTHIFLHLSVPTSFHNLCYPSVPHPPSIIHVFLHLLMYLSIPLIHSFHYLLQSMRNFEQLEDVMQSDPVWLYFSYIYSWEELESPQLGLFFLTDTWGLGQVSFIGVGHTDEDAGIN